MGMIVSVYRDASSSTDCTNGGMSKFADQLTITNVDGPFEPTPTRPAATLESGPNGYMKIVPANAKPGEYMAGGNYAGTNDSRFGKAVEKMCGHNYRMVAIHDRQER